MFSSLTGFSKKIYIVIGLILALILASIWTGYYVNSLKSDLEKKSLQLEEANENNTKIIEAYEYSLKVQAEISKEEAISIEEKEKVIIKNKVLTKEIQKRGVIKEDENSNFTIFTF
jgi:hypothetical protein